MARYVTRSKVAALWWPDPVLLPYPCVYEREPSPTGLLDASGHDLYRMPEPIGFVRDFAPERRRIRVKAPSRKVD